MLVRVELLPLDTWPMDETRYHTIADATLLHCFDQLDDAYEQGAIDDLALEGGILTIKTETGRTFILSKHAPSRQLWLASPISGGLHFRFVEGEQCWALPDDTRLYDLLRRELAGESIAVVL